MTLNLQALYAEFPRDMVTWRPQGPISKTGKVMALAYIDARDVMDRLDAVVGPANWSDDYHETPKGRVICTLSINIDGVWVRKADGAGETQVEGEKGAISDALKRAAVKWGIGRYLYDIDSPWVPCETYQGNDGKPRFKRFSADPWSLVRRKPRVFELPPPDASPVPDRALAGVTNNDGLNGSHYDPDTGEIPPTPAPEGVPHADGATIRETWDQIIRAGLPEGYTQRQYDEARASRLTVEFLAYKSVDGLDNGWAKNWQALSELETGAPDLHATLLAVHQQHREALKTAPPKKILTKQIGENIIAGIGLCGSVEDLERYTDELGESDNAHALDHPKIKQAFADRRRVLAEPVYYGDRQIG
jgi:hypothetical protein